MDWVYSKFKFVQYNPRKKVDREGLSITSLDGGLSGIPDLDSLREYNLNTVQTTTKKIQNQNSVADYPELKNILDIFGDSMFRCHILKLNPVDIFLHIEIIILSFIDSFRLIMPLQYVNPPFFNFVIDGDITHWDTGFHTLQTLQKLITCLIAVICPVTG